MVRVKTGTGAGPTAQTAPATKIATARGLRSHY